MKLRQLQKHLAKKRIGACLLTSKDSNFFYFSQEKIDTALMLILKKGKPLVIVSRLEKAKSKKVRAVKSEDFIKTLKQLLKKNKIRKLAINQSNIKIPFYKKARRMAKLVDIEEYLDELRIMKTKEELKLIKKACSIADKILAKMTKRFKFRTELDVKKFLKIEAIKHDCEVSFEPIVANGRHAIIPHYMGNSRLKKGFLLVDFGLKYKGYCSDITRTFYLGRPSKKEKELYNKVLKIQKDAIKKLRNGMGAVELDRFVRNAFGDDAKYFFHGLGHGLGARVHEKPNLYQKSKDVLKNNMVFTIEPGYYKKVGIRIEDDVLLKGKAKVLTRFPKRLIAIKRFK